MRKKHWQYRSSLNDACTWQESSVDPLLGCLLKSKAKTEHQLLELNDSRRWFGSTWNKPKVFKVLPGTFKLLTGPFPSQHRLCGSNHVVCDVFHHQKATATRGSPTSNQQNDFPLHLELCSCFNSSCISTDGENLG